jgi:hypothetical protein
VLDVLQTETDFAITALSWHLGDAEVFSIESAIDLKLFNIVNHYESPITSSNSLSSRDASKIAKLISRRIGSTEKLVLLFSERSPRAIIATLAVLKSGDYFVTLDLQQPTSRLMM